MSLLRRRCATPRRSGALRALDAVQGAHVYGLEERGGRERVGRLLRLRNRYDVSFAVLVAPAGRHVSS